MHPLALICLFTRESECINSIGTACTRNRTQDISHCQAPFLSVKPQGLANKFLLMSLFMSGLGAILIKTCPSPIFHSSSCGSHSTAEHPPLTYSCPEIYVTSVVWTCHAFENNFRMKLKLTKYLKGTCR